MKTHNLVPLARGRLQLNTGAFAAFLVRSDVFDISSIKLASPYTTCQQPLFYANMSTGVAADAVMAVTMTWLLVREKSSMNFRR